MKREILFRGKRVDNGEWVEGYYFLALKTKLEPFYGIFMITPFNETPYTLMDNCEVDYCTLGQYTGLIDKNGNKIFEGDIVNCKTVPITLEKYIVRWDESHAKFIIEKHEKDFSMTDSFEYEIIGNIFDNPELMESGR